MGSEQWEVSETSDWSELYPEVHKEYLKSGETFSPELTYFKYKGVVDIFPDFEKLLNIAPLKMDIITTLTNYPCFTSIELYLIFSNIIFGGFYTTFINPSFKLPLKIDKLPLNIL